VAAVTVVDIVVTEIEIQRNCLIVAKKTTKRTGTKRGIRNEKRTKTGKKRKKAKVSID